MKESYNYIDYNGHWLYECVGSRFFIQLIRSVDSGCLPQFSLRPKQCNTSPKKVPTFWPIFPLAEFLMFICVHWTPPCVSCI